MVIMQESLKQLVDTVLVKSGIAMVTTLSLAKVSSMSLFAQTLGLLAGVA